MTTKPRLVLDQLIAAFENHYEVASSDQVDEQALIDAEEALRDAFFTYDDVLFTQFEVELPFDLIVSDEEDEDEDFDDDDEDDQEVDEDDDEFIDLDEDEDED
ncbi:DNA primase [uncultured Actinomyces sp.]|uniref:DNA primase n=1 Tax=uncultured Actinomyces sp. TaxID=249061 RepID=UPI0028E74250|nr:DNA primase [uncultured Actinomyces sp.]